MVVDGLSTLRYLAWRTIALDGLSTLRLFSLVDYRCGWAKHHLKLKKLTKKILLLIEFAKITDIPSSG